MGITGEIVRSVFSKNRSERTHHDINVRSSSGERKRWSAVRSYLCGDEINSVLAEEDSASWRSTKNTSRQLDFSSLFADEESVKSIKGSEATVTQPTDLMENEEIESNEKKEEALKEKQNSTSKLFVKDDAAVVIQSAFRSFLARRKKEMLEAMKDEGGPSVGNGSPSRESIGTSIEVQTANSVSLHEEVSFQPHRTHFKGNRSQVWKLKEDWDDSTLSSNVSKMRIQNRLEATTRRERALAYAFSQQLRVCAKKKQSRSNDGTEPNMGWNWLERWMATKQQEGPLVDINKQIEQLNGNQNLMVKRRLLVDLAGELEKESCGSNEVSLQLDGKPTEKDYYKPARNRLKATNLSKRKTVPTCSYSKESTKVSKKDWLREDEKDKMCGDKQEENNKMSVCEDATSQVSPGTETSKNFQSSLRR